MPKKVMFSFLIALLIFGVGSISPTTTNTAHAITYNPILAKPSAPSSVIVIDLAKERTEGQLANSGNGYNSHEVNEAYVAILTIQGIVNRTASQKIYFVNSPWGFTDLNQGWKGANADQWIIDDGLLPVTRTNATLNTSKRWPALSYLLSNYSSYIKGKILMPDLGAGAPDGLRASDNGVAAAVTAAGQTDAIPVSTAVNTYLATEGINLSQTADTRSLTDPVSAYNWAKANYFNANTNRKSVRILGNFSRPEYMADLDYQVATRSFVTTIFPNIYNTQFVDLMSNYPAATLIWGNGEGPEIGAVENAGHYWSIIMGSNYSALSSFSSNANALTTPTAPTAAAVTSNGAYVSFHVTDGDNVNNLRYYRYDELRSAAGRGAVALGWTINPQLFDIAPTLFTWYANNNYSNKYELISNFNDGGPPRTSPGVTAYANTMKYIFDNTNGVFKTMLSLNANDPQNNTVYSTVNPYFALEGYQGNSNGNSVTWFTKNNNNVVVVNVDGVTQGGATAQEIENAVRYVVNNTPAGTPAFVDVIIGAGIVTNNGELTNLQTVVSNLTNSPNGRSYNFIRPRDLAATWRSWQGLSGTATPTPTPTPTPSPGTNVALNKTATASSVQVAGVEANNAFDGNNATRWSSLFSDPQWIYVDLGAVYSVNHVKLNWETAYATSYQIQISTDATNWTNVYSTTTGDGAIDDLTFTAANARYVRMYGTARGTQYGYSLWEFEVYNSGSSVLNRTGWTTSASNSFANRPTSNSLDGDINTMWQSGVAQANGQWFQVDMGSQKTFKRITMDIGGATGDYPRGYQVFVSNDGINWGSAVATGSGSGQITDVSFTTQTARYLRVVQTGSASNWWSIAEYNVYN